MVKKKCKNQNETDVILSSGECIPRTVYMNDRGKEMNDAELGTFVRKNYEQYLKTIEENMPYWQEEGESFRQARQALNISQRELAEGIGVSPITVGKYEKGKPVRSRKSKILKEKKSGNRRARLFFDLERLNNVGFRKRF